MPPSSTEVVPAPVSPGSRRSLEGATVWVFLATLVVAILIVTPFLSVAPLTTKTFILAAGVIVTLVLYILARLSRGNIILPPLVLVGVLWLPAIAYLLSSFFSGIPFGTALWGSSFEVDTLGFILVLSCVGTLSALVLRRGEQYRSFLRASGVLFTIVVGIELLALLVGQVAPNTISPAFSILGTYEDLAYILGLGVIGSLITLRFLDIPTRVHRVLVATTVVALFLLAIANSVFVWVLLALVSLGLFIEAVMMRGRVAVEEDFEEIAMLDDEHTEGGDMGSRSLVLPLVTLAVSLFFLIGGALGNALAGAFHINVGSVSPSWQSTLTVAQKTYSSAPVFGTGPGTFGINWLKYRDPSLNGTVFWNTDFTSGIGFIPTSAVSTGMVGLVAWLLLFGFFIVIGARVLIARAPQEGFVRYVSILSFVATLYLFATAVFRLPSPVVLALAFVFAGLFASTVRYAQRARQRGIVFSRSPRLGFVIVFVLTLVLLGSIVVAYTVTEHYVAAVALSNANTAFAANKLDLADRNVQTALSFAPSATAYEAQADIAVVRLTQIAATTTLPTAQAQQAFQSTLSSGLNAALTATRLAPNDYQAWLALGNLYAQAVPLKVSGAYDSAKGAYDKALALNPTNPQIRYIMAQVNIANNDLKSAQDDLKAAIQLKPDYTTAIFLLSQIEVQTGNVKDALNSALAAAYFSPNDPGILFQVGVLRAATGDYPGAGAALGAALKASPQFANARYFLAAIYAKQGDMKSALEQLQMISGLSEENAKILAPQIASLQAGKNPFPANLLSASSTPVKQ